MLWLQSCSESKLWVTHQPTLGEHCRVQTLHQPARAQSYTRCCLDRMEAICESDKEASLSGSGYKKVLNISKNEKSYPVQCCYKILVSRHHIWSWSTGLSDGELQAPGPGAEPSGRAGQKRKWKRLPHTATQASMLQPSPNPAIQPSSQDTAEQAQPSAHQGVISSRPAPPCSQVSGVLP